MDRPDNDVFAELDSAVRGRIDRCCQILRRSGKVVVAFSGGVDSTFLLALAVRALGGENVIAAAGVSPSFPDQERKAARELAQRIGARLVEAPTTEMNDPRYTANPSDRCFFCKSALLTPLKELAAREAFSAVVTGANADDAGDFRPGLRAGKELGVGNPLMDAGLTKADIRAASKCLGLPTWDKPSYACLSSRIPYGESITAERLGRIEKAEHVLHQLGLTACRVRDHGQVARLEVPAKDIQRTVDLRDQIIGPLKELGYKYVALDLQGFRSGSMNEAL